MQSAWHIVLTKYLLSVIIIIMIPISHQHLILPGILNFSYAKTLE